MKPMCIILSFAILLTGCYSHTTVTKDDIPNLDNKKLVFKLTDDSYITSKSGQHRRVENGYEIRGQLRHTQRDNFNTLNYQRPDSLFDGLVFDKQITNIVAVELNTDLTIAAAVGGSLLVTLFTLLTIAGNQVAGGL
jgi:hypothetical protein